MGSNLGRSQNWAEKQAQVSEKFLLGFDYDWSNKKTRKIARYSKQNRWTSINSSFPNVFLKRTLFYFHSFILFQFAVFLNYFFSPSKWPSIFLSENLIYFKGDDFFLLEFRNEKIRWKLVEEIIRACFLCFCGNSVRMIWNSPSCSLDSKSFVHRK